MCVAQRGIGRLAGQTGFAAIPHDRAQESEIGGWQRAPVGGDDTRRRAGKAGDGIGIAVVGIIHGRDGELRVRRNRQADSDQTLVDQQFVGFLFGGECRDIVARTRGAVDQPEDRVGTAACRKAGGNVGCADGPAILRLVAAEAGSAIGSEILEERIVGRERRSIGLEGGDRTGRIRIDAKARNDGRSGLLTAVHILEALHLLHVVDHAGRERRDILGRRQLRRTAPQAGKRNFENENLQNTAGVTRSGTIRAQAHGYPPYAIFDRRHNCRRSGLRLLNPCYSHPSLGIHGFGRSAQYPLPSPVPKKNCGCASITGEGTIAEVAGARLRLIGSQRC